MDLRFAANGLCLVDMSGRQLHPDRGVAARANATIAANAVAVYDRDYDTFQGNWWRDSEMRNEQRGQAAAEVGAANDRRAKEQEARQNAEAEERLAERRVPR